MVLFFITKNSKSFHINRKKLCFHFFIKSSFFFKPYIFRTTQSNLDKIYAVLQLKSNDFFDGSSTFKLLNILLIIIISHHY